MGWGLTFPEAVPRPSCDGSDIEDAHNHRSVVYPIERSATIPEFPVPIDCKCTIGIELEGYQKQAHM